MAASQKELSIILPAYNEAKTLAKHVREVQDYLSNLAIAYEILIVDDGSKDNTYALAQSIQSPLVKSFSYETNRGKGYAIKYGMKHACGKYRLFMDVDLSTSLEAIKPFLSHMRTGKFDVVIGNRRKYLKAQVKQQPLYRRFFGRGFTYLSSLIIGYFVSDFTCGFKIYSARAADIIFPRQRIFDWAFDTELIYIAHKHKLRIHQFPVEWQHHDDSKVRLANNILTSLQSLLQIRINILKGYYN